MTNRYFHGGVPWLNVGELLLPPERTGARQLYDALTDTELDELAVDGLDLRQLQQLRRRDVVYVTIDVREAELFARLYPHATGGAIYECQPAEPIEEDPDYRAVPVQSFTTPEARIVRILRTSLRPNAATKTLIRAGGYR